MTAINLYMDEDSMDHAVVRALRAHGVHLTTALDEGMIGRDDDEHLEYAAAHGWVLCTCNVADFQRLHTRYLVEGKSHAGIILVHQQRYSIGEQVRRTLRLVAAKSAEDMRDHVEFLSAWG